MVRKLKHASVQGIKIVANPTLVIEAAKIAGVPLTLAFAMLSQESGGGLNEWGHDATIFVGGYDQLHNKHWGSIVTKAAYLAYKAQRTSKTLQGVGPMQLTSSNLQDEADKLGGAWKPLPNMIVGFRTIEDSIRQFGLFDGLQAYNAGPGGIGRADAVAYARSVLSYESGWARELGLKSVR